MKLSQVECTYHDQHGGRRGHLVDLDHGEDLGHLTLAGAGVKQSATEYIGNSCSVGE